MSDNMILVIDDRESEMYFQSESSFTLQGQLVPPTLLKKMDESNLSEDLPSKLNRDGYLLIRKVYDPDDVIKARNMVLQCLYDVGEVKDPYESGTFSGFSNRRKFYPSTKELGEFWKKISEMEQLRRVINGEKITKVMNSIFGEQTVHFSFAWLRAMIQGKASPVHIDHPYMNRGTDKLVTCWTPLGEIAENDGTIYVLEKSHLWKEIREKFLNIDIDSNPSILGHIEEKPLELVNRKKSIFLTSSFNPGDCLIFGMFIVHGSFDNNNRNGKIRLSCDTRFQPKSEPMDPRFSGSTPEAHRGLGYGCLSSSLPLTEVVKPK